MLAPTRLSEALQAYAVPCIALQSFLGVQYEDLCECCMDMIALHQEAFHARDLPNMMAPSMAISDKFADRAWHCVSHVLPLQSICLPRPNSWKVVCGREDAGQGAPLSCGGC